MTENALLYPRVSTGPQEDGTSLDTQEAACRAYAEERGYNIVGVYREVHTGADLYRPQFDLLRQRIAQGGIDVVVIYDVDRMSREQFLAGFIIFSLKEHGVRVEFVRSTFDDTSTGKFLLGANVFAAEHEREKIIERTSRGKAALLKAKKPLQQGTDIYGYTRDKEGKRWIVNHIVKGKFEGEAKVVTRIFRLKREGLSYKKIANQLNADGIPAPSARLSGKPTTPWTAGSVQAIVKNPAYKGLTVAGKFVTVTERGRKKTVRTNKDQWNILDDTGKITPPIVDAAVWDALNDKSHNAYNTVTFNDTNPFLLRGRIICGHCRHSLTPLAYNTRNTPPIYRCYTKYEGRETCQGVGSIHVVDVDALVWEKIREIMLDPGRTTAELRERYNQGPSPQLQEDRATLIKFISQRDREAAAVVRDLRDPDLSERSRQRLKADLNQLEEDMEKAEKQLHETEERLVAASKTLEISELIEKSAHALAPHLDDMTFQLKRKLIDALQVVVVAFDKHTIHLEGLLTTEIAIIKTDASSSTSVATYESIPFSYCLTAS